MSISSQQLPEIPSPRYVAVIGDIVASRTWEGERRRTLQKAFQALLQNLNEAFAEALKIPKEEFFGKTVFDFYSAEIARGRSVAGGA